MEVTEPLGASDHHKLEVTLLGPAAKQDTMEEEPDWKKANFAAMKLALEEFEGRSGVECLEVFYEVVMRETERCIPKKMRRKSSRPLWMSKNIIRLIRKKRRLWQNYTSSEYYRQNYGSFQVYKEVELVKKFIVVCGWMTKTLLRPRPKLNNEKNILIVLF